MLFDDLKLSLRGRMKKNLIDKMIVITAISRFTTTKYTGVSNFQRTLDILDLLDLDPGLSSFTISPFHNGSLKLSGLRISNNKSFLDLALAFEG